MRAQYTRTLKSCNKFQSINYQLPNDLDIPTVGQLLTTNLPLGNEFQSGPVKMIGFEASFRRRGLREQYLEHPPGNSHLALIVAHPDAGERLILKWTGPERWMSNAAHTYRLWDRRRNRSRCTQQHYMVGRKAAAT
jgi:hypothetical protein